MLKCPVCGNEEFRGQNLNADFLCPVAGCGGIIRVKRAEGSVRSWERPKGGFLDWAKDDAPSPNAPEDSLFIMKALDEETAEVCGVREFAGDTLSIPSHWQGRSVVRVAPYAFKGTKTLKKIKLPDTLKYIGCESFAKCEALETAEFGEHIELIDSFAFRECIRLNKLTIQVPPLCVMETAFAGCYALCENERSKMTGV